MKKIETKIAKNGTKMYYVEGKRVNREVAIQTAADNRGGAFIINREKKNYVYSVVSYVESGEYTSTDTYEFNKIYFKTTYNGTELWVNPDAEKFGAMVFGSYNKDNVKKVAADIEAAFISGAKGVTIKENATVEVVNAEANPDDYAVSQEAMDVAVDAETELANTASKAAKKNYSINPVIGDDDNMKLNHVDIYTKGNKVEISGCFECKNIETAYRRFRKIMIQIDADHPELQLGGENDWLPANKITLVSTGEKHEEHFCGYNENGDMIFSASPVEALAVDINEDWFYFYGKFTIENIKEETQMTNNLPTGIIEVANGADAFALVAPYFPNGLTFKCAGKGFNHETIFSFADKNDDELWLNVCSTADDNRIECVEVLNTHENGSKRHPLTVAIVANEKDYHKESVELADKIRRDAQPCDDNDDVFNLVPDVDAFDGEQTTIRDKYWQARAWLKRTISKGKECWFLFGRRVKKDSVDVAALLYDYGLTPDKFAAEDQKVIDEEQRETAIRWANWQKKWFAEYLTDKIKRDSKSYDDSDVVFKLTPDDDDDDDELIDPPVDSKLTADIAKYQAAFEKARQISIRAGSGVCKINGEEIWFNYGNLRSISSDNYRAEITFNNGRKRFRYRGIVIKRADFLDRMSNEIVAAEQKETFGEFLANYQMPDTALDPNADYFQIRIFPKLANGTESSFHATANDFDRALELIELFKSLNLPFIGLIKRNTVCGEEYYRHNRDGSEVINPPEIDNTPAEEPYRPFTVEDAIESLNHSINWAKGILATMQGDTYTDDIGEDWTRSQLETAIIDWQDEIADLQPQADKTAEPPKPVELVAPTVMSALDRVKIKARSLRDSINRAIKTCVKNRIAYRKNHNAEMEKYEYELMHLLQAARRELEVA